jgi:hypothetical protein
VNGYGLQLQNVVVGGRYVARAHSFGHFLTQKHEISRTFALKKCKLLSWPSFSQFFQKCELFLRAISRF